VPADWFKIRNATPQDDAPGVAAGPALLDIYDEIGRDWFNEDGITAKEFVEALRAIPTDREILVSINSPGGNVWDGLTIYHQLAARRARVTVRIDGMAGSIASIIALAGRELQMPEGGLILIHDPSALVHGNADEMKRMAGELDKHADVLAGIYARKTGRTVEEMRDAMRKETLYNGAEAKAIGFADTLIEDKRMAANAARRVFSLCRFPRATTPAAAPSSHTSTTPTMKTPTPNLAPEGAVAAPPAASGAQVTHDGRAAERTRINGITAIYHQHRCGEIDPEGKVLGEFTNSDRTVEDMQAWILENRYKAKPVALDPAIGMSNAEVKRYSLVNAIRCLSEPGGRLQGLEAEASAAVAKKLRQQPKGFFVPHDIAARSVAEAQGLGAAQMISLAAGLGRLRGPRAALLPSPGTAGGFTIGTDVLGSSLIELLRNKQLVASLGARVLSGLIGDVAIPRHTGGATAYWTDAAGTTTSSDQTFGQLGLTPHKLGASTPYSKQLLAQSSIDVEAFVREDLMTVLAIEKDRACLNGLGAAGQPLGIINTSGIGAVTFGAAATRLKAIEFQTDVASGNASMGALAYVTTPAVAGKWMGIDEASSTAQWLWKGGLDEGIVVGRPAYSTNQVPSDLVIYGNWNDFIIADWDGIDVVVNPYSLDTSHQVRVTVHMMTDNGIRHVASFSVSTDSGAQ
jgi:HK97 family phage major capsid protein